MWVLTREVNDYDQHGHYLITVFEEKPSKEELKAFLQKAEYNWSGELPDDRLDHVLSKGGIQNGEGSGFFLKELSEGELYQCDD